MMRDPLETLAPHARRLSDTRIEGLFDDPGRFSSFSATGAGITLDWSKTRIDGPARDALLALVDECAVRLRCEAMFSGQALNNTENRAVLHTALRCAADDRIELNGENIVPAVVESRDRMLAFAEDVRNGIHQGTGGAITDVVNIGIGGSDLGPEMVVRALDPYADGPRVHFVSNVDGASIAPVLRDLDPATTLLVIVSKSFGTIETKMNADTARSWLAVALGEDAVPDHVAAISTNRAATEAFGVHPDRRFDMWDWVGGRYSIWSAVGLSVAMAIGARAFRAFLTGAAEMDAHFRQAAPEVNLPILLALTGIWHRNAMHYPSRAVVPYDQRLSRFPAYLQQLDMESNGKSVRLDGSAVEGVTGPTVWGEPGTNSQHAFFQLLHQGSDTIPVEFLIAAKGNDPALDAHHRVLMANCLAQSRALMCGRSRQAAEALMLEAGASPEEASRLAPHRTFPGNRPSVTIAYDSLTPRTLGSLIALYEHRVFVEGSIWGINSYDQWGVELGKALAEDILPVFGGDAPEGLDPSTTGLADLLNGLRVSGL